MASDLLHIVNGVDKLVNLLSFDIVFQSSPIRLSFFDLYIESQVTCLGGSDSHGVHAVIGHFPVGEPRTFVLDGPFAS